MTTNPSPGPEVLERRLVAESRVFRIEQVDLLFANGARRTFERIPGGSDSVLILPLLDPDTLLLIREYSAGTDRYELGFPKGVIEPGEDPLAAANREIREEVGYAARDLRPMHRLSLVPGYIGHRTQVVLARDLYGSPLPGDEPEPLEVVPWRLAHLDALLARDDFDEARCVAALLLLERYLRSEAAGADAGATRVP